MAILRTRKDCTIFETNAFYRVESANLGVVQFASGTSSLSVSNAQVRFQPVTFSNAGNFKGLDITVSLQATDRTLYVELQNSNVVTITIASPGIINWTGHGLAVNTRIMFTTTGALPTGIITSSYYYVKARDANSFYISAAPGGANINFTGTQSGTHYLWLKSCSANAPTVDQVRGGSWTSRYPGQDKVGVYTVSVENFDAVVPINTTVGKWRFFFYAPSGTTGQWNLMVAGNSADIQHVAYSDTQMSFTNGDSLVIGHYLDVDQSFSVGGVLSLGDTANSWGGWILSNINDISVDNVSYLRCLNPSAPLTVTFNGRLALFGHSGFRVGTKTNPIPRNKQVNILFSTPTVGTARNGFASPYNNYTGATAYYGSRHSMFFYGAVKTEMLNTLLSVDSPVGGKSCTISIANPALFTYTAHGLSVNDPIVFSSTGSLPAPLTPFTTYYVSAVVSLNTFRVSATLGGANISTLGSTQSGAQMWARVGDGADVPAVLTVNDDVEVAGWEAGDLISIGKCLSTVAGTKAGNVGNSNVHTIASVSGNQITLTSALVNNQRLAGGSVFRVDERDFGIVLRDDNTSNAGSGLIAFSASNINIEGCFIDRYTVASAGSRIYDHEPEGAYQQWTFKNCTHQRTGTGAYYFVGGGLRIPAAGVLVQNCHSNGGVPYFANWLPQVTPLYRSGTATFDTITSHQKYNGYMGGYSAGKGKYIVKNHWITNAYNAGNAYFVMASGNGSQIENIDLYGNVTQVNYAQLYFAGLCNGTTFKNIKSINSEYGLTFQSTAILQNCIFDNLDVSNNVTDFYQISGWLSNKVVIKNSPNWVTGNYTDISNSTDGSNLSFVNANGVIGNDRTEYTNGILKKTTNEDGETCMQFQNFVPGVPFEWETPIPTEVIQNKTLDITIFCDIKSELYFAGEHQQPTITCYYDDGAGVQTSIAGEITGKQKMQISITPQTTAGEIRLVFSVDTDAVGADGYVEFTNINTFYPANVVLELGQLKTWSDGLPLQPFISTGLTSKTLLSTPTNSLTEVGSLGQHLAELENPTLVLPSGVII